MRFLRLAIAAAIFVAPIMFAPPGAQELPAVTDEMLGRAGAVLHVDVQTGRVAGVTSSGPVAEVGAKIIDVLFSDYTAGERVNFG